MYVSLPNPFSQFRRAYRPKSPRSCPLPSFKAVGIDALEGRRLLAVAPVPSSPALTPIAETAYLSTVDFKAAALPTFPVSVRNQVADLTLPQATVSGFHGATGKIFEAAAVNRVGAGFGSVPSAAAVPATPVSRPGAPTALNVRTGDGQVSLTWSEPTSNGNSGITAYQVSYSSDSGRTWSVPLQLPATARTATISALVNGTKYQFRVASGNAARAGLSATVSATPTNPNARTTVQFMKVGTFPVTVQYSFTIRDANGKAQTRFLNVDIGSLDRSGAIQVPDFARIEGSVRVSITVRNLPRGMTKTQAFTVAKKTNYSMRITYQQNVSDPWMATSIQLT